VKCGSGSARGGGGNFGSMGPIFHWQLKEAPTSAKYVLCSFIKFGGVVSVQNIASSQKSEHHYK
jgi:hypothetical protein